jgi:hypothetical protein
MRSECAFTLLHGREGKYYDSAVATPACTGPVNVAEPAKQQLWFLNLGDVSISTSLAGCFNTRIVESDVMLELSLA